MGDAGNKRRAMEFVRCLTSGTVQRAREWLRASVDRLWDVCEAACAGDDVALCDNAVWKLRSGAVDAVLQCARLCEACVQHVQAHDALMATDMCRTSCGVLNPVELTCF
jgi:hypothetical protein